jgi:hypothetical protein
VLPGIDYLKQKTTSIPFPALKTSGLTLGTVHYRGADVPVHLPFEDLHQGQLAIPAGAIGTGKSTLLANIAHQLVDQPQTNPGLLVLDPHGTLVSTIASQAIPPERVKDTYLFEFGKPEQQLSLPIFSRPKGVSIDDYIEVTYETFRILFQDVWSPTRMADAVQAITATLCYQPKATILDFEKLIQDPQFRRRALSRIDDPVTQSWWTNFENHPPGVQRDTMAPIFSRLRRLYRSRAVRNILCQTSGVDFAELIDEGKICLVSLAGRSITAEQDLMGELIIAKLYLAVLGRFGQNPDDLRRVYFMIDESQRFKGSSLPRLFSESRKVLGNLLIATQFIKQWSESLAQSVLGNVSTLICFRCGPLDSALLSRLMRPYTHDQLEDLNRFEAVVKMQVYGNSLPAFDIRTLPLEGSPNQCQLELIRKQTKQRFSRKNLDDWHSPPDEFQEDEYLDED